MADAAVPRAGLWARVMALATSDYALIAAMFLVSRAVLVLVGFLTLHLIPGKFSGEALLPDLFVRFDSRWYLDLAQSGYSVGEQPQQPGATNFAFYPVYPGLIWLLGMLGMSLAAAGVLISNVCFLAALMVMFALGKTLTGSRDTALISVALISFVPQGFVFSAVYTESLFLLLTAASMLAFVRERYVTAAALSAVNSAVRSNGVLIAVWYGLEIVRKRGLRGAFRFWEHPEEYLPVMTAPLGLVLFWWFSYMATGDAFAQKSTVLHGWAWAPAFPWNNVWDHLSSGTIEDKFWVIAALGALAVSLLLLRKGQWTLFCYCLVNFALYLTGTTSNSLLRYSISILPLYYGVSYYLNRNAVLSVVIGAMGVVGGFLMAAWALERVITI